VPLSPDSDCGNPPFPETPRNPVNDVELLYTEHGSPSRMDLMESLSDVLIEIARS